jgi:hypothetical protein
MEILGTRDVNFMKDGSVRPAGQGNTLLQQMRKASHISILDTVKFGGAKPHLPLANDSDEYILDFNTKAGTEHARRLAKTTPVVTLGDMKGYTIKIELRKVAIPDRPGFRKEGIGLFIDGKPWMFQPNKDTTIKYLGDFFPPHDIQRHILVGRDRTMHLPTIAGEYLTGMVSREGMLSGNNPPRLERMWDGLIANFADAALPKSSFKILEDMIGYLSGRKFPVGSSIRLEYHVPPADIAYRDTGRTKNAHFMLNNEPVKKIKAIEQQYQHPTELFTRLFKLPDAKMQTLEKDGEPQVRMVKFPPVGGLTPVWEFKTLEDKSQSGESLDPMVKRYWLTSDGKKLDYEQAQRRLQGKMPDARVGEVEYYQHAPEPRSGSFSVEVVGEGKINTRRFNSNKTPELEPVYTGHPYRPVTLERVEVRGPDGKPAEKLHFRMPGAIAEYKKAFKAYQDNIQEFLEKGHIPMDSKMEVQVVDPSRGYAIEKRLSVLEHYRGEIQEGKLPADMSMTMDGLYSAMARYDADSFPISFPGEDLDIAAFPPPPYGGKHFKD